MGWSVLFTITQKKLSLGWPALHAGAEPAWYSKLQYYSSSILFHIMMHNPQISYPYAASLVALNFKQSGDSHGVNRLPEGRGGVKRSLLCYLYLFSPTMISL